MPDPRVDTEGDGELRGEERDVIAEYLESQRLSDQPYFHADRIIQLTERWENEEIDRLCERLGVFGDVERELAQHRELLGKFRFFVDVAASAPDVRLSDFMYGEAERLLAQYAVLAGAVQSESPKQ